MCLCRLLGSNVSPTVPPRESVCVLESPRSQPPSCSLDARDTVVSASPPPAPSRRNAQLRPAAGAPKHSFAPNSQGSPPSTLSPPFTAPHSTANNAPFYMENAKTGSHLLKDISTSQPEIRLHLPPAPHSRPSGPLPTRVHTPRALPDFPKPL